MAGREAPLRETALASATVEASTTPDDPRERALESIKRKRAFWAQVGTFVAVSIFLTIIWAVSDEGFFWPIFPIGGFLLALAPQAWSIWGPGSRPISEAEIERESQRLNR